MHGLSGINAQNERFMCTHGAEYAICDKTCDFCWEIKGKYGKSAFKNDADFPKRKSAQSTQNQVISKAKAQVTEVFDSLS